MTDLPPTAEHASSRTSRDGSSRDMSLARRYWAANLRVLAVILALWALVSFGFSILLVDDLNRIDWFGFKMGFWWAQQGAIYVFVGLIFAYAFCMDRIERRLGASSNGRKRVPSRE